MVNEQAVWQLDDSSGCNQLDPAEFVEQLSTELGSLVLNGPDLEESRYGSDFGSSSKSSLFRPELDAAGNASDLPLNFINTPVTQAGERHAVLGVFSQGPNVDYVKIVGNARSMFKPIGFYTDNEDLSPLQPDGFKLISIGLGTSPSQKDMQNSLLATDKVTATYPRRFPIILLFYIMLIQNLNFRCHCFIIEEEKNFGN
ncbi:unnamed protein product [Protopolystoma xenopodis]|uniref:Uncharacterized protein n=1 Tax=Protopolystoma xenopodis TaxID=117903 RepID=A0A448WZE5_9PLAT|nr:unnamed protein product [Protopolystoma xenopodis]